MFLQVVLFIIYAIHIFCAAQSIPSHNRACPTFADGDVDFDIGTGVDSTILLYMDDSYVGGNRPLIFYWHGLMQEPTNAVIGIQVGNVTAAGGIIAAPDGPGDSWSEGTDLPLMDTVTYCAVNGGLVDPTRIHSYGMSMGGLWTSQIIYTRSSYLASAAVYSGGLFVFAPSYEEADNRMPVLIMHGGVTDTFSDGAFTVNFDQSSETLRASLDTNGHTWIMCNHHGGHYYPVPIPYPETWPFFQENTFNTRRSYVSGDNTEFEVDANTQCTIGPLATSAPTDATTIQPTETPTSQPTETPTEVGQTFQPTDSPTEAPTSQPTEAPTETPTNQPTETPTETPTGQPTEAPTEEQTIQPTEAYTPSPTIPSTLAPGQTAVPTENPTDVPTSAPTDAPTESPTEHEAEQEEEGGQEYNAVITWDSVPSQVTAGGTVILTWNTIPGQNIATVAIIVLYEDEDEEPIIVTSEIPNNGFFSWNIPDGLNEDGTHSLIIVDPDNYDNHYSEPSVFTVIPISGDASAEDDPVDHDPDGDQGETFPWWIILVAAVGFIILVIAAICCVKRRQAEGVLVFDESTRNVQMGITSTSSGLPLGWAEFQSDGGYVLDNKIGGVMKYLCGEPHILS